MSRPPDLSAALVRKGEAAPISPDAAVTPVQPTPTVQQPVAQPRVAPPRTPPATVIEVDPIVETEEPRVAVTTRLRVSIQERIRILSFKRRIPRQDVIDAALTEYLDRNGV
jgi:hypothetical protein